MIGKIVCYFLSGCLLGVLITSLNLIPKYFGMFFLIISIAFLFSGFLLNKNSKEKQILLFVLGSLFFGIFIGGARFYEKENEFSRSELNRFSGKKIILNGYQKRELSSTGDNKRSIFKTNFLVSDSGAEKINYGSNILLILPADFEYSYGESLEIRGSLKPIKNFDESFDYSSYEKKDGVLYEIYYPQIISNGGFVGNIFLQKVFYVKDYFEENIVKFFSEPYSSLLSGMVIAGKGNLTKSLQDSFLHSGIVHIVVLSGYNIALIVSFASLLFSRVHIRRRIFIIFFLLIIFILMAGLSASVVRAAIAAVIGLSGKIFGRKIRQNRALLLGATLMVLWNPYILVFDPSFALTFLATFAIINVSPVVEEKLIKVTERFGVREILAQTISAEILVTPYILYQMGNFSVFAPVTNILVLPVVPFITIGGIILGAFGFLGYLLYPLILSLQFALAWVVFVAESINKIPGSFIYLTNFSIFLCLSIYFIELFLYFVLKKKAKSLSA
ncbi:MAG: ComEC/Rec2 family competence protein [Candidatus Paceibacterota bacterium]